MIFIGLIWNCAINEFNSSKTAQKLQKQSKTNQDVARNDIRSESVIVDAPLEQTNTQTESTERPTETSEWVVMDTPVHASHDSDDIPTFDEALDMEVVAVGSPQNDVRRRVSSRLSLKSEELPDYENYESHPVISGIEKF